MSEGSPPGTIRVLLRYRAARTDVPALVAAYHRVSQEVSGANGLRGNELLRAVSAPGEYAVASEWNSIKQFQDWAENSAHRLHTSLLDNYRDPTGSGGRYEVYEIVASYRY